MLLILNVLKILISTILCVQFIYFSKGNSVATCLGKSCLVGLSSVIILFVKLCEAIPMLFTVERDKLDINRHLRGVCVYHAYKKIVWRSNKASKRKFVRIRGYRDCAMTESFSFNQVNVLFTAIVSMQPIAINSERHCLLSIA